MFVELGYKWGQEFSLLSVSYCIFVLQAGSLLEKFVQAQIQENLIWTNCLNFVDNFEKSAISTNYIATEGRYVLRSVCVFQLLIRIILLHLLIFELGIFCPICSNRLDIVLYFGNFWICATFFLILRSSCRSCGPTLRPWTFAGRISWSRPMSSSLIMFQGLTRFSVQVCDIWIRIVFIWALRLFS